MPRGEAEPRRIVLPGSDPLALVERLGREEREAIAAGDWTRLDEVLSEQKSLWRELTDLAGGDSSEAAPVVAEALKLLYHTRRQNHALIERSFAEVRRQLLVAHAGSDARSAYLEAASRAA